MQTLFNRPALPDRGIHYPDGWTVVRAGLARNLSQVVSYYHNRSVATKSNHLLAKLLGSARLNYEAPLERFYDLADTIAIHLSMAMGFTSTSYTGKLHEGVFYGKGTQEVIVGSAENFDVHAAAEHWRYQTPVRVIYHEKSDLDMHVPNGMAYSQEKGLAVIVVNIPLLFVMYRGFVHEQLAALKRGQQAKTTSQFLLTYVLPNMVASHLDFALFNRLLMLAMDLKPLSATARKHPFSLPTWTTQADKTLKAVAANLTRSNHTLHDMLCSIPAVTAANCAETMQLPTISQMPQYSWVEIAARARTVAGCIFMSPSRLLSYDKQNLQRVDRTIAYEGVEQRIKTIMGAELAADVFEMTTLIQDTAKAS